MDIKAGKLMEAGGDAEYNTHSLIMVNQEYIQLHPLKTQGNF